MCLPRIVTIIKTRGSVKPRDRAVSFAIAVFSIVLGVFLILLPGDTAALVLQIAGIGFILKALAELYVGFRNRSLILATGETISQIKEM